jgi:hypothetical protein
MNSYINDRSQCVVLSNVSEHNTWSASVVYKDGTEENIIIIFILNSVTWKRKRRRENRLKYSLLAFGEEV